MAVDQATMSSLRELFNLPGLDSIVASGLGPVAFQRLSAASRPLKGLLPPCEVWRSRWVPSADPKACEAAAMLLLRTVEVASASDAWEDLMEELYVLTAAGRPKIRQCMAVHNLLDVAVQRPLRPTIPLLRMRGYELEMLDAYSFESLVQRDNYEAVAAYLDAGISPDIRANAGRPVLMVAVAVSANKVASLLLERKADVHQRSGFGQWTALMWAAHAGSEDSCKLLLEAGAKVGDLNDQGLTALDIARQKQHGQVEMVLYRGQGATLDA